MSGRSSGQRVRRRIRRFRIGTAAFVFHDAAAFIAVVVVVVDVVDVVVVVVALLPAGFERSGSFADGCRFAVRMPVCNFNENGKLAKMTARWQQLTFQRPFIHRRPFCMISNFLLLF